MKITKGNALLIGLFVIAGFGVVAFIKTDFPSGTFLTAVVSLVGAYITLDVANNGVKGKFFNKDLYNAENGDDHDRAHH